MKNSCEELGALKVRTVVALRERVANSDDGKPFTETIESSLDEAVTLGRLSVLRSFDNMCKADGMVGLSDSEWKAIKAFFAWNKEVTGWDKEEENQGA